MSFCPRLQSVSCNLACSSGEELGGHCPGNLTNWELEGGRVPALSFWEVWHKSNQPTIGRTPPPPALGIGWQVGWLGWPQLGGLSIQGWFAGRQVREGPHRHKGEGAGRRLSLGLSYKAGPGSGHTNGGGVCGVKVTRSAWGNCCGVGVGMGFSSHNTEQWGGHCQQGSITVWDNGGGQVGKYGGICWNSLSLSKLNPTVINWGLGNKLGWGQNRTVGHLPGQVHVGGITPKAQQVGRGSSPPRRPGNGECLSAQILGWAGHKACLSTQG